MSKVMCPVSMHVASAIPFIQKVYMDMDMDKRKYTEPVPKVKVFGTINRVFPPELYVYVYCN